MKDATFALALGCITFLLTVIWGGPLLAVLRHFKIGKQIRIDGPQAHIAKMGTPTMGGILIVAPVLLISALVNVVSLVKHTAIGRSVMLPLAVLSLFALLGAMDDWQGLRGVRRGEGLRGRQLIVWQTLIALAAALGLYFVLDIDYVAVPAVPFLLHLGIFYIPAATFVIVGCTNAVNFTDGLDGLCGLMTATAFAAYGVVALLQGQVFLARFSFTLVGALFAFLWFNAHPAELFMGGSGSYALGATLAVVALMTGQWLLLPIIAIVPVGTALSVIGQVLYFKLSRRLTGEGRRLFRMAPLHHHFELGGWSETQVVQRFWLVELLAAMIGVALALL